MTVDITVNWNFLGQDKNVHVAYGTHADEVMGPTKPDNGNAAIFPFFGSVLPLGSSVLAPGLSMPVPAR